MLAKINPADITRFAESEHAKTGREELNKILARSATDREFRELLLTSPREAFKVAMGQAYDGPIEVHFIEKRGHATIVLPDFVDPAAELSDSELETVAGGTSLECATIAIAFTSNTLCFAVAAAVVITVLVVAN